MPENFEPNSIQSLNDEIKGLDAEEFLIYALTPKTPELMMELITKPLTVEKLLVFAKNICLPAQKGYDKIRRDMLQKGLVARGDEPVPMSLSIDLLSKMARFCDILDEYTHEQLTIAQNKAKEEIDGKD